MKPSSFHTAAAVKGIKYFGDNENLEKLIEQLLIEIGEDPKREGLLKTPSRVAAAWEFLANGYQRDIYSIINDAIFKESYDEMVTVRDIDFFSLCEHHMLPFFGKCHVAYMPRDRVIGLSKIPLILEHFSRGARGREVLTRN